MQFADIKNDVAFRKIFGWAALRNENKTEILISFLNAVLKLEGNKKISWVEILNKLKDLDFNFIELSKFTKTEPELETLVDKWVYFIKNAENLTVIPPNLDDEGLQAAYTEANKHQWKKEDLEAYQYAKMREADEINREKFVQEKAKLSKQIEIAKNLINLKADDDFIVKATNLTIEQVEELRAKL
jgi:predicted transposase/invertase (TIGR01784 family)